MALNEFEKDELEKLRKEDNLNSLGDRPHAMSADKLKRFIELTAKEKIKITEYELFVHSDEYAELFMARMISKGCDAGMARMEYDAHAEGFKKDDLSYPQWEADECMSYWTD